MPFVKGQSGNPAGRPRGCRNKVNRRAEVELDSIAPTFMGDLVVHARQGNPTAMRLVAERTMPVSRQRPVEVELPPLISAADRGAAVAQISRALGEGDITIGEAAGLLAFVREALALAPAAPSVQAPDLAAEVAGLREEVARLSESMQPTFLSAGCRPNIQENHYVEAADGKRASMEINAESIRNQCEINAESMAGSMPSAAGSMQINDRSPPAAETPAAAERAPVNIRKNTGLGYDPMAAVVVASSAESE